ncbi:MAG TPA: hypothetical protein VF614_03775 [Chthoniobacteraceae bacterium]
MKHCLFALSAALLLTSCAGVKVIDTQVASGAANPKSIYIRPFDATAAEFRGAHRGGRGERPIRQSLAGREFANILKQEMEKIAPARVLEIDEVPTEGWIVEGSLDVVNGGSRALRHLVGHVGVGRSQVLIHVRISEVDGHFVDSDKDANVLGRKGRVIYEFDVAGGSKLSGPAGTVYAPGAGHSATFDYRNAAERIMMALSMDPHRHGLRNTPTIRD